MYLTTGAISGGEVAAVLVAATALLGSLGQGLRWLLAREYERGRASYEHERAEAYKKQSEKTIAAKDAELTEKDAEIAHLRAAAIATQARDS